MQKNKTGPVSYITHKITWKLIKNLNIRTETIRLLEENIGKKLLDIEFDNDFFGFDIKSTSHKSKNQQVGLHQTKNTFAQQRKP